MDFNLKQWRHQQEQQHESDLQQQQSSAKLPRRLLLDHPQQQQQEQHPSGSPAALPLFVPEHTKLTDLSALPLPAADSTITSTRFPKMGSYFSLGQWQELELQALIFRHMLAGATVPPQLLHLLDKSLLNSSPPPPPPPASYYLHHPLQHYSHYHHHSHYHHPALLQTTGYWGRASMDPEPGRCRRTDGKKWRCSRDVVAGQKYCERHVHRGRNRSRKPVEIPTPSTAGGCNGVLKINTSLAGGTHFDLLSGPSPSIDLLHLSQRPSESRTENKGLFKTQNEVPGDGKSGAQVLRHFFDDWSRSLHESDNARSNAGPVTSSTGLSISTLGNPTSDFSLKLATGNGDEPSHQEGNAERERLQLNWAGGWGTNQVAPMGGPLAEALRSSTSNSSPTSVLYHLQRSSTSETSYVST